MPRTVLSKHFISISHLILIYYVISAVTTYFKLFRAGEMEAQRAKYYRAWI